MSALALRRRSRQRSGVTGLRTIVAVTATMAVLVGVAFVVGRAAAPVEAPGNAIHYLSGVPVGVDHSMAGALAAADSYVAVSYEDVERNPAQYVRLINTVYVPTIRASAISGAAAVRAQNRASMSLWASGGQDVSLIGARRLDYYRGEAAQISTWNVNVFWGPGRLPKQASVVTRTSLRWSAGRWMVTAIATLATSGPVPALTPQATASNDSAGAFDATLAGYTAPGYGTSG